jgi:hypothetical protein
MKQNICLAIILIGILAITGIVGGCDHGQPLTNAWWCVPILGVMWCALSIGDLFDYEEDK